MFPELKRLIEQMGKDRGIDREIIVKALEDAMITAARKKLGPDVELEAHYNEEVGEIEVFQFKTVMEKVLDPTTQVSLTEARRTLDEEAEPGDSLGIKIDTSTFGRIAVQTAKQIIIQRVKDAERDNIYEEYHTKKGDLCNGFVQRFEGGNIIVNLGRAEGIIPIPEQIFKESYKRGERIRAFICDVKKITKGPQIILPDPSRFSWPSLKWRFLKFRRSDRDRECVAEPERSDAVKSRDKDIDRSVPASDAGTRVQSVVQELRGEKIDIIPIRRIRPNMPCSALSGEVNRVCFDDESWAMEVIVPDDQLSLAIGKNGQNVRLAVKLTGWKIDVKNESTAAAKADEGYKSLMKIPGIGEATAERLFKVGLKSMAMLAAADSEQLAAIPGVGERRRHLIEEAGKMLDQEVAGQKGVPA